MQKSQDSQLTMSLGGTQPGKEDPSHHVGKREIGLLSTVLPKLYAPCIDGMVGRQLNELHDTHQYLKHWKKQPLSALRFGPQTITKRHIGLQKGVFHRVWHCKPQQLTHTG